MNLPAVPNYVSGADDFADCPPGHRFNLYFPIWNTDWLLDKNGKATALGQCLKLGSAGAPLHALRARQQALAEALPENRRHIIEARSTAPFATGLGLEHPVENGFAFLSPYGLPYLAGSGVKGVLRRAAEELEIDGQLPAGTALALFGHADPEHARRGALSCWDVFPKPAGDSLVVEIMTPHFNHYLQDGDTPHDAGKPNPIPFLAVPAGAEFRFVITCEPALLGNRFELTQWKDLLDKIIHHAFDWLGFGAKTAVGYGAVERLSDVEISVAKTEAEAAAKRCDWVDQTIENLSKKNNAKPDDTLRGKGLAEAWKQIADTTLQARAKADIKSRWQAKDWWDKPPTKNSVQAKALYTENDAP
jgi:CRISPR-associated protein Cmr6